VAQFKTISADFPCISEQIRYFPSIRVRATELPFLYQGGSYFSVNIQGPTTVQWISPPPAPRHSPGTPRPACGSPHPWLRATRSHPMGEGYFPRAENHIEGERAVANWPPDLERAETSRDGTHENESAPATRRPTARRGCAGIANAVPDTSRADHRNARRGGWRYGCQTWMRSAYSSSGI
jgi:hypothetical protein